MGIWGNRCKYCHKSIPEDASFCIHCGKEQTKASKKVKDSEQAPGYTCPHCGGEFKVFSCLCPHCGREQTGQIRSKSILQFTQELQRIDEKKSKSGVGTLLNGKKIKNLEEQKLNYIQTFVVPNSKEDVLEFMVLASSNFNPYMMMAKSENEVNLKEKEFQRQKMLANAWHTKMEQVYQKAHAAFGQDEDFIVIKRIYEEKERILKRLIEKQEREQKNQRRMFGGVMGVGFAALLLLLVFNYNNTSVGITKAQTDGYVEVESDSLPLREKTIEVGQDNYSVTNEQKRAVETTVENKPTEVNQNQVVDSEIVYITKTGKCYHRIPNCRNSSTSYEITKSEAISRGFEPCGNCYKGN